MIHPTYWFNSPQVQSTPYQLKGLPTLHSTKIIPSEPFQQTIHQPIFGGSISHRTKIRLAALESIDPTGVEQARRGIMPDVNLSLIGQRFQPPIHATQVRRLYEWFQRKPKRFSSTALQQIRTDTFTQLHVAAEQPSPNPVKKRSPEEWLRLVKNALDQGYTTHEAIATYLKCSRNTVLKYMPKEAVRGRGQINEYKVKQWEAKIADAIAKGHTSNEAIAKHLKCSKNTVLKYRKR